MKVPLLISSLLASAALACVAAGPPPRVPSFGPNGTHWPDLVPTPFLHDETVPHVVQAGCSWEEIARAIREVTDEQAAAGVLIKVAPGQLTGPGAGAGSPPVLKDLGSEAWKKRVTVCPRDGYGTVTVTGGVKIETVHGVCFAGFSAEAWKLQGCKRSALAWTKLTGWLAGYGQSGQETSEVEFVEVVQPQAELTGTDTADAYAGSDGGDISGWRFTGCYGAPRYRPADSAAHTDTLQFGAGKGGAKYSNMTLRDCAYFASNNCAIQTGALDGLTVDHCYIASGDIAQTRYPWPEGADNRPTQARQAFNGSGRNFTATDSVFIGSMRINTTLAPTPWIKVVNTRTNTEYGKAQEPAEGSWSFDPGLSESDPPMPPLPTDEYLAGIWRKPAP